MCRKPGVASRLALWVFMGTLWYKFVISESIAEVVALTNLISDRKELRYTSEVTYFKCTHVLDTIFFVLLVLQISVELTVP